MNASGFTSLHERLERAYRLRQREGELCAERPDPLLVAGRYRDERIALICALFGYGSATAIVRFLEQLDFMLLEAPDEAIIRATAGLKYRFQDAGDIAGLFIALKRLYQTDSIEAVVQEGYRTTGDVCEGVWRLTDRLHALAGHSGAGFRFLVGGRPTRAGQASAHKRWMMYLRWMVRKDNLDMGLWRTISPADLIMPLDTHTHRVSLHLGLLERKSADLKAARQLTQRLKAFDPLDPVKYDFALYRIGQEKLHDAGF